jgi:hypothetical protein
MAYYTWQIHTISSDTRMWHHHPSDDHGGEESDLTPSKFAYAIAKLCGIVGDHRQRVAVWVGHDTRAPIRVAITGDVVKRHLELPDDEIT